MEHLREMWRQASKDVVFNSVSDDPWRWDHYTEKWPPRNLTQRTKRVGEITMHLVDYGDDREIYARIGDRVVGTAYFGYVGADLRAAVQVDPKYRRRGVATAMYVWAEEIARDKLTPDIPHTPLAEALWNQPNRPFGRTAAMKDVAYRGVSLQLDARRGEPILEALVKRQTNVAARLIIDAMAETVKDRWWAAGAQESDEAGRWWTSKKGEAEIYAMGVTDAWMTLPVVMTASFEGAEGTGYNDGTYVWHLPAGHPVMITEFAAMLPDDPQHLLDGWRGVTSPGNHDTPGTYWDGTWTKLNVPQMRTTASFVDSSALSRVYERVRNEVFPLLSDAALSDRDFRARDDFDRSIEAEASSRCTNVAFEALTGSCPSHEIRDGGEFLELITKAGFGYVGLYDLAGLTLRQLVERPEVKQGSFYVFTSGHALALVDGVLTDAEGRGPDGRRVKGVYRITERRLSSKSLDDAVEELAKVLLSAPSKPVNLWGDLPGVLANLSRTITAMAKRFGDFERGQRVIVDRFPDQPGTIRRIQGQGNAYTKGYLGIEFDSDPGRVVLYPWREVSILEGL